MVDDLSHLVPTPASVEATAAAGREASLLRQFITWLGARSPRGKLTTEWFHGEYPGFPFLVSTARVKSAKVQDFFERPTKTPAFETYMEEYGKETSPAVLLFKSTGFTPLALFNAPVMGEEVRVCLRFSVRGTPFFVATMKEFCDAYRERAGPLGS